MYCIALFSCTKGARMHANSYLYTFTLYGNILVMQREQNELKTFFNYSDS